MKHLTATHNLFAYLGCILLLFPFSSTYASEKSDRKRMEELAAYVNDNPTTIHDSMDVWLDELIHLSGSYQDWETLILAHRCKARYSATTNDIQEALSEFQKMYEILSLYPIDEEFVNYFYYSAFIYNDIGEKERSFEYMLKAQEYCEKIDAPYQNIRVSNALAYHYSEIDMEKAFAYAEKSLAMINDYKDYKYKHHDIAQYYHTYGNTYVDFKQYEKAVPYLEKAIHICDSLEWHMLHAYILLDMGKAYTGMKQYEKSVEYTNAALAKAQKYNFGPFQASVYSLKGYVNMQKNQPDLALENYLSGLQILRKYGIDKNDHGIIRGLSNVYKEQGDLMEALKWNQVADSVQATQEKTSHKYALILLENDRRINEITHAQELEKQSLSYQYIVILLVCLLLIAAGIIFLIALRKKAHQKEKERLAIQLKQQEIDNKILAKQDELTNQLKQLERKNESISEAANQLTALKESEGLKSGLVHVQSIIDDLNIHATPLNWKDFEKQFIEVDTSFYANLQNMHPNLSPGERKLCAYLKLGMSSKEISAITFQSSGGIDTARTRLRKKLGLDDKTLSLAEYMDQF